MKLTEKMTIVTGANPPSVSECAKHSLIRNSKECKQPGFDAETLGYALRVLNHSYEIFAAPANTEWGKYENGSWTGLLAQILNGTFDTIITNFVWTQIRLEYFAFTFPINEERPVFIVKQPSLSFLGSAMLVYRVFDPDTWLLIIGTFVTISFSLVVANRISHCYSSKTASVQRKASSNTRMAWNSFRLIIGQTEAQNDRHPLLGVNFLFTWLGIIAVFVMSLFQGTLSTSLLHPPEPRPFNDWSQIMGLIGAGKLKLIMSSPSDWYYQEIVESNTDTFKELRAAIGKSGQEVIFEPNITRAIEMVATGRYLLKSCELTVKSHLLNTCGITTVPASKDELYRWRGFIIRKDNPFRNRLDDAFIKVQIIGRDARSYYPNSTALLDNERKCLFAKQKTSHSFQNTLGWVSLSVNSLAGVFITLIVGLIGASLLFYVEMLRNTVMRQSHQLDIIQRKISSTVYVSKLVTTSYSILQHRDSDIVRLKQANIKQSCVVKEDPPMTYKENEHC